MYNGQCNMCAFHGAETTCGVCVGMSSGTVGRMYLMKACTLCTHEATCFTGGHRCTSSRLEYFERSDEKCPDASEMNIQEPAKSSDTEAPAVPGTTVPENPETPEIKISDGRVTLSKEQAHALIWGTQIGGNHYKNPNVPDGFPDISEFLAVHDVRATEGNVMKYVYRHDKKNGFQDIMKCFQYLQFIAYVRYGKFVAFDDRFDILD